MLNCLKAIGGLQINSIFAVLITTVNNKYTTSLYGFLVCVAEESSQRIGLGGYAISVAIVSVLHVSQVINAPNVHGGG